MDPTGRRWLAAVDRQCVGVWTAMLPAVQVEGEVGEHVWLVSTPPWPAETLLAPGLARFVLPVAVELPVASLRHGVPPEAEAALAALAGDAGTWIFPLRRHGRLAAKTLAVWAAGRGNAERSEGWSPAVPRPLLVLAASDDRVFAGAVRARETGALWPPGAPPERPAGPSRAGAKLAETFAWLEILGVPPPKNGRWLELGAFPGGMTAELSRIGLQVTAVDVRAPEAEAAALPGVAWVTADALVYEPDTSLAAIVCDVNGPPSLAAKAIARLARWLEPGGLVIHTLKLPAWAAYPELKAQVSAQLEAAGLRILGIRHLWHNRQEVAVVGRR
jgi:hypothetical protein